MKKIFFLNLIFFFNHLHSQDFYINNKVITLKKGDVNEITFSKKYNAISLRPKSVYNFENLKFYYEYNQKTDSLFFSVDEHSEIFQSNLLVINETQKFFFWSNSDIEMEFIFQFVKPLKVNNFISKTNRDLCEKPQGIIPQNIWRQGLPEPTKGRELTKTKHCVIHHSADGNGNNDYTQLVRSYYIHHTQTNGWDDIGYNYLIAYDGSIYAGRDPEKQEINQDNVLGAHFCGKNIYTMGICLIGNFNTINPSDTMANALIKLLSWKYVKDTLNPISSFPHPDINSNHLNSLIGHKDGCATECPGNNVYNKLNDYKSKIYSNYINCLSFVSINEIKNDEIILYPQPSNGIIFFNQNLISLKIINSIGKEFYLKNIDSVELEIGIYVFEITTNNNQTIIKKIIIL